MVPGKPLQHSREKYFLVGSKTAMLTFLFSVLCEALLCDISGLRGNTNLNTIHYICLCLTAYNMWFVVM